MSLIARLKQRLRSQRHEDQSRTAFAQERFDDAVSHARALYEFDLGNTWANYLLACHHLEADRYADALPHLERVCREWPDDAWVWYAVGLCHDWQEHFQRAADAYAQALALAPHWSKALKNIGQDFYHLGDFPAAEDALRRYCDAKPDDREAHDLLGYVCYRQGKFRLSFGHYEQARLLDPLDPKSERNARLLYAHSARS